MESLGAVLEAVCGSGTLLSVQPGGNHGDTLIYRGFEKVVSGTGVDHRPFGTGENRYDGPPVFPTANVLRNARFVAQHSRYLGHRLLTDPAAVYVHGGGNFNDVWASGIECFGTVARYFDCPVVVGPQSCRFEDLDPARIFGRVDNDVHFFCREEYSYDIVREAVGDLAHVSLYLADDTALSLRAADLPVRDRGDEYTLVAMRADAESASPLLRDDLDAPVRVSDVSVTADSFAGFVDAVARAESVQTDRLHVAVLATLLDTPVTWYEIGYHKARGVYEHSLADRETVTFVPREQWA